MLPGELVYRIQSHDFAALEAWLEAGHDVHMRDSDQGDVMHYAFCRNSRQDSDIWVAGIRLILKYGYDVNIQPYISEESSGMTPMHYAAESNSVDVAIAMLDAGANIDDTPVIPAAYEEDEEDSDDEPIDVNETPLALVVKSLRFSTSRYMTFLGSELVEELCAYRSRQMHMIRFLLSRGASPQLVCEDLLIEAAGHDAMDAVNLVCAVRLAGGWKRYVNAPRKDMLVLRELCARGRAAPPSALAALFCTTGSAPSRPRTRRNPRVAPLPTPIFWHVLSYWRSDRDFDPSAA